MPRQPRPESETFVKPIDPPRDPFRGNRSLDPFHKGKSPDPFFRAETTPQPATMPTEAMPASEIDPSLVRRTRQFVVHEHGPHPAMKRDVAQRMQEREQRALADTRSPIARMLGDPEPGRSALWRKRAARARVRLPRGLVYQGA